MRVRALWTAALVVYFSFAAAARGAMILINFDDQVRGTVINNQYTSKGVTISADNFTVGHPDIAITFDSNNHTSKTDTDLQYSWSGGNLKGNNGVRKVLIIAENATDKNNDKLIDDPNDEGGQPAGFLKFKFKEAHTIFGFDLIDIDGPTEYKADRGYVSFRFGGAEVARVGYGAFVDNTSKYFDISVQYGNRTANHMKPITTTQLGIQAFDEVWFNMGWSSAIDAITYDTGISIIGPEPTCLAIAILPLMLLGGRPKRQ